MNTSTREQPLVIQGRLPDPMLGVLHLPGMGTKPTGLGVVVVNGGAQYRAGAHRLFVLLARHLAAQGHAVLRFDLPGQGDSPGQPVGYVDTAPHIGAAINALHRLQPHLAHTALAGLCDGASASLLYLHTQPDPRVSHLVLLNPWVQSESNQAKAQLQHYYRQRLVMPDFWKKLLSGRVAMQAGADLLRALRQALQPLPATSQSPSARMAQAWHAFPGQVLLLLSTHDQTAQTFQQELDTHPAWRHWAVHPGLQTQMLQGADHTASPAHSQAQLLQLISDTLHLLPERPATQQ